MILFAVGSAILTALGRVGFGPGQALAGRYVTISALGLIGLYLAVLQLAPKVRPRTITYGLGVVLCGLVFFFLVRPMYSTEEGAYVRDLRTRDAYYLANVSLESDRVLQNLYPDAGVVRQRAEFLRRHSLNVFSAVPMSLATMRPTDEKALPSVIDLVMEGPVPSDSRTVIIPRDADTITLIGHARDEAAKAPAGAVFAELDGRLDIPALNGLRRKDVTKRLGMSWYGATGFEIAFSRSLLTEGRHSVRLKVVSADKQSYCVTAERLILEVR